MNCKEIQIQMESGEGEAMVARHLADCSGCAEYAQLRAWSARVLEAGRLEANPPLMSSVWASIHRASEQAWDTALRRSFRQLMPYMVGTLALMVLLGSLSRTLSRPAPEPVTAAAQQSPYAVLNGPELPAVFTVLDNASSAPAGDVLGGGH